MVGLLLGPAVQHMEMLGLGRSAEGEGEYERGSDR